MSKRHPGRGSAHAVSMRLMDEDFEAASLYHLRTVFDILHDKKYPREWFQLEQLGFDLKQYAGKSFPSKSDLYRWAVNYLENIIIVLVRRNQKPPPNVTV